MVDVCTLCNNTWLLIIVQLSGYWELTPLPICTTRMHNPYMDVILIWVSDVMGFCTT